MDLRSEPAAPPVVPSPMLPGVTVVVETLLLGVRAGRLTYRIAAEVLGDDEHPDTSARLLAGLTDPEPVRGRLLHSTSWRFAAGSIVLTYAALPDPDPRTATALEAPADLARGAAPLTPSPERIEPADVVVHACRHLAFLRRTDPVVAAAAGAAAELWDLLDAYRPEVAGQRTV